MDGGTESRLQVLRNYTIMSASKTEYMCFSNLRFNYPELLHNRKVLIKDYISLNFKFPDLTVYLIYYRMINNIDTYSARNFQIRDQ